jgi:hypothetical protein
MINEMGVVHQVKCKIYTFSEAKEKLLVAMLKTFLRHVGH